VDDCADACLFLMQHYDDPEIINIGHGKDISIRDLALMIKDVAGFAGDIVFDPSKPDGTPRKLVDCSRIFALGWRPTIMLSDGIRATYGWFTSQATRARRARDASRSVKRRAMWTLTARLKISRSRSVQRAVMRAHGVPMDGRARWSGGAPSLTNDDAALAAQAKNSRSRRSTGPRARRMAETIGVFHAEDVRYLRFVIPEGARVLELGCASGICWLHCGSRRCRVDFSEPMVEVARRQHPHLQFAVRTSRPRMDPAVEDRSITSSWSIPSFSR